MNVELSRIAQKKLEQMGGEIFGVVFRDRRGRFATISEMGLVTWLDEQLSSNPEPLSSNQAPRAPRDLADRYRRQLFECQDELHNLRSEYHNRMAELESQIEDLQNARAQGGDGSDAVGVVEVAESVGGWAGSYVSVRLLDRDAVKAGDLLYTQPAQQGAPEGFALMPESICLSYEDIENIVTMTGWDEGRDDFGEGVLWVGSLKDDDGNETYGLNISCIEVMEEGALPVCEFEKPAMTTTTPHTVPSVPEGRIFSDSEGAREFLTSVCKPEYSRYICNPQRLAGDFACHIASLLTTTPHPAPSVPDEAIAALSAVKMRIEDCYVAMAPSAKVAVAMVLDAIRLEKESRTPMFTSDTPQPADNWISFELGHPDVGIVWYWDDYQGVMLIPSDQALQRGVRSLAHKPHWMPTGLKRPNPPEQGADDHE